MLKYIALIVVGVLIAIAPVDLLSRIPMPGPLTPLSPLAQEVKQVVAGRDLDNLQQFGASLNATANLFDQDAQRQAPYYNSQEKLKWATRRVGELSYPSGYIMDEKYPGLKDLLGRKLKDKLGESYTHSTVASAFREISAAIEEVAP